MLDGIFPFLMHIQVFIQQHEYMNMNTGVYSYIYTEPTAQEDQMREQLLHSMRCALMEEVEIFPLEHRGMVPIPDFTD